MIGEALQWAVLLVFGLLLLGVLRQLSLMLPAEARVAMSGPAMMKRLPRSLLDELRSAAGRDGLRQGAVLAFITENCLGCQQLLADIEDGRKNLNGQEVVLVAKTPSPGFLQAVRDTGLPVVPDVERGFWNACKISATPLVVQIDGEGRVIGKEVTHHVDAFASVG